MCLQEGKVVNVWCLPLLANKIDKQQSDIADWQSAQTITTTQLKNGLFCNSVQHCTCTIVIKTSCRPLVNEPKYLQSRKLACTFEITSVVYNLNCELYFSEQSDILCK